MDDFLQTQDFGRSAFDRGQKVFMKLPTLAIEALNLHQLILTC